MMQWRLVWLLGMVLGGAGVAETVKDRAGAVLKDREVMEQDPRWIYNDFQAGFQEARTEGKPLLVVLRCVPCLACAGIDAQVLQDATLQPLLNRFVCVRLINANDLDLSLFQFDYDLSFSTVFFNGDGTVYGRYGSWTHQKDAFNKTVDGFKKALGAALTIHAKYPGNRASLAGKQGAALPFKNPLEIPELAGKYERQLDWSGKVVQSCVHCHQVSDAIRGAQRDQTGTISSRWIYPWPGAETIGLVLASDQIARVESVAPGSMAARAGLQAGDEFVSLAGQPLVSIADVSWILHLAPDAGSLAAEIKRGDTTKSVTIPLEEGWRSRADISRRVGTWPMRAMALGGLQLTDLPDEQRVSRGLTQNQMALLVKHAGQFGKHAAAKNAGFRKDDVLVEVGKVSERISESALIGHLLHGQRPGDKVPASVLRGGERIQLMLPMQ